jgi:hypothetical protein
MAERMRLAGAGGLSLSDFTRAFQGDNRMVREQRMKTLVTGETVFVFQRKTPGRTALTLVHHTFAPEYQAQHPEERRVGLPQ